MQADADGSGSVSFKEYIEMTRNNQNREFPGFPAKLGHSLSLRLDDLEAKVDAIAEKMDKLFDHLVTTRNVPDNEADYR